MKESKQVLVVRKDLKMRRGKEIAQGAHASLGALLGVMDCVYDNPSGKEGAGHFTRTLEYAENSSMGAWLQGPFTKVCLCVTSEEELLALDQKAKEKGVIHCLITDSGRTEFNGVPTKTVLAIGPDAIDVINEITGHLTPY
jgi:PTH2 family peptidyl-tRNA hydrolase